MKISILILKLFKFWLKGFRLIDFYVDDEIPPVDYCDFIIGDCNFDKSITLVNFEVTL